LDDGIVDTLVSVGATRSDNAAADSRAYQVGTFKREGESIGVSSILWDRRRDERRSHFRFHQCPHSARNPLAQLFEKLVNKHSARHGAGNRPQQYDWLGNIRELQNVIERAIISVEAASRPAADRHQGMMDVRR
jgi:hypothetical protein